MDQAKSDHVSRGWFKEYTHSCGGIRGVYSSYCIPTSTSIASSPSTYNLNVHLHLHLYIYLYLRLYKPHIYVISVHITYIMHVYELRVSCELWGWICAMRGHIHHTTHTHTRVCALYFTYRRPLKVDSF